MNLSIKKRCAEGAGNVEFSRVVPGIWNQHQDGLQMAERFLRQGLEGMEEDSRRPRSSPKQLSEGQVCEMVKLKLGHRYWGPRKIRTLYHRRHGQAPSESSFKRVLEQVGLTQPRRVREGPLAGGRLSSGRRGQQPNEVWTVDFKGWWHFGESRRCEPLTVRDEFSRYVLELRAMDNARSQTVREAFERIFERHGLPEAIRSDNGAPFASVQALHGLSRLSAWWVALGIDLERGRPAHPQDNGGHERLHRDIAEELESLGREPRQRRWSCGERRPGAHPRSAGDALSGGTLPELEQALPRDRSANELSRDGGPLGGQKRQAELEEPKGLPDREPGRLGGRAPKG